MSDSRRLVAKVISTWDVLRDAEVGVLEYTEQLTYLRFRKMAHEWAPVRSTRSRSSRTGTPGRRLLGADGIELEYTSPFEALNAGAAPE